MYSGATAAKVSAMTSQALSKRLCAVLAAAAAACGVAAAPAAADSILYLKGGDVWLSTPDGSRQFQVTQTGGYSSASQSDDGTIVALKGQRIHKLDRLGTVQADFTTAVSDGTDDRKTAYVSHFEGPHEVDLSPDGKKVAYNWHWQYWTTFGGSSTGYHMLRQGVGVSAVDRATSWSEAGMGYQTGWLDSAWYDDDTLVYGNKASAGMMDIAFNDVGRDNVGSTNWFYHDWVREMRMPAVSPDRGLIAHVGDSNNTGSKGQQLWVWKSTGPAPALPTVCNVYGDPNGGTFDSPAFSPDGKALTWAEGDGIYVAGGQDKCVNPDEAKLVIPGGSEPDWAAADVPAGRPAKDTDAGAVDPGTKPGAPTGSGPTAPVAVTKPAQTSAIRAARETAPKPAATLTLSCRAACTVSGTVRAPKALAKKLRLGSGALATGRATTKAKGSVRLELRLTPAGRAAIAKLKGKKLTVTIAVREGGKTRRVTKRVALSA